MTPSQLLKQVLTGSDILQAFAAVCGIEDQLHVYILHRLAYYTPQLGIPTTQWDNHIFATNGDVTGKLVVMVQFPDNLSKSH